MSSTSVSERNRAIVAEMYDCGIRGDYEKLFSFLAADVVVDEPSYLPYGGQYRGLNEFVPLFTRVGEFLDLSKITVDYLIADGARVAACLHIPDRKTGRPVELLEQSTLRDGLVVHMKLFYYDMGTMLEHAEAR